MSLLSYDFMQRALLAAVVIGVVAPMIGVFLVQRRLALLGDGMGHVALTGVGLSFLLGTAPVATALALAVVGAVCLELIRARSRTAGDVALAVVFYGGLAGGVMFTSLAGGQSSTALNQYLFGSISTVSSSDLVALLVAGLFVVAVLVVFGRELFAVSLDPETAHTQGIRTQWISGLLTVLASVTVVIGMRSVGLLLVSAIMILPVAASQQWANSFRASAVGGVGIGLFAATAGLVASFYLDVPPGPTIVFVALGVFLLALAARPLIRRAPS
jgi:zinc transport system permease protein